MKPIDYETGVSSKSPVRGKKAGSAPMPSLFDQAVSVPTATIAGMVRGSDSLTAQAAAVRVEPGLKALQSRIMEIIRADGPQTDRELEIRPEFSKYGPSTVRKRRSELSALRLLMPVGERDRLQVWGIPFLHTIPEGL
jgi:hypothetical protein